jgi:hypothetical protein
VNGIQNGYCCKLGCRSFCSKPAPTSVDSDTGAFSHKTPTLPPRDLNNALTVPTVSDIIQLAIPTELLVSSTTPWMYYAPQNHTLGIADYNHHDDTPGTHQCTNHANHTCRDDDYSTTIPPGCTIPRTPQGRIQDLGLALTDHRSFLPYRTYF